MPDTMMPAEHLDAVIIGAGFSGMYQLHLLRDKLGLDVRVLEMGEGVGGTWYWNRYPGARCDSESHSYCYMFSKELQQEWEWSERYPQQPEIMRYMNFVAEKLDLKRSIRFGTRVTGARYDAAANLWRISTARGQSFTATYLITAVGCLSTANVPKIPGLESFEGDWYHTGEWPHEGVDFTGKRVGQIGTGSTGIQAVPVIAAQAKHLTVFQRTANYSVPAHNAPLTPEFKQWVKANYDHLRAVMTSNTNGHPFNISQRSALDADPAEREALFEQAWAKGGLQFRATFGDILQSLEANATAAEFIKRKIRSIVKDPATAELLADIDHPYAAKRPPIDSHYFETFNRDNVTLVDVRKAPIERITPRGIVTGGREYEVDIIVFATGFDAMTGPLLRLNIEGRDGQPLSEAWAAGPRSHLGLQVPGFPNMFTITGPGSPSVLCNMPVAIEQHAEWIADCIAHLRAHGIARMEATAEAADSWVAEVNRAAEATLLPQASSSWYLGANVPGKPRVFMPYAGGMAHYAKICADVAARGYEGFALTE
ncbi:flavin-containing monooxygenase [Sediminicoccus rosea]|jgi:cation diffusion facilitator CzcD-associated flavoprotein CzcO|uniref:NAD(P)/FAD-dependent oxidoreductase n=1 Tax=Sediminicoccus rosea TaxID=1225128 RepID=A0ABZ0PLV0_9PROT|nr:NAD(P)/FAD-dependent oxidoreductase [Sediminicoccus rosea]WPB86714.1 NAD(P)/FAD-dependent oxidoreductase [Sediminicoccus rosea]